VRSHDERKDAQKKALDALQKAYELDSHDYLIAFHLSLQYAEVRDVTKALQFIKTSLTLNPNHSESWNLLALLLSSQKHYADALVTINTGLQECSDIK
jgi:tetratricopeptide (TPR) repeat protein